MTLTYEPPDRLEDYLNKSIGSRISNQAQEFQQEMEHFLMYEKSPRIEQAFGFVVYSLAFIPSWVTLIAGELEDIVEATAKYMISKNSSK